MLNSELSIRICGEAGQGMQTIGVALGRIFKNSGFYIFAHQDYMSRIRGGNNYFQIRVSSEPVYTLREKDDLIIALDKNSVKIHEKSLSSDGIMVLDKKKYNISEENLAFFDAALYDTASKIGGSEIFINSMSVGLISGMIGLEFGQVEQELKRVFANKSQDIIDKNINVAKAGYELARTNLKKDNFKIKGNGAELKNDLLLTSNEAIALGAVKAGCKFYSAYPMTPSTSIMDVMAHFAKDFNIIVEQAEDEIAAINMCIGASFTGVRAMTGTSGGGFALMNEGLSLAAMTETPIVIYEGQRPAPATGLPTRTEQADLNFLIHAGHGEFARVIFTPGTIEEAFYLTIKAFNLAEKYQIPVLIMSDTHLADSYRNVPAFDLETVKVQRSIISKEDSKNIVAYKRYQLTENGISPRAIPSWIEGVIYADSDEHTEEGHITEDALVRASMVEKRFYKKMAGLIQELEKPVIHNFDDADILLVSFGSNYGILKEISQKITSKKIGFVHLTQVWPFPATEIATILNKAKKIVTVENNAGAQLAKLIRRETGIEVNNSILKYDGRPFSLDYLTARLMEV